MKLVRGKGLNDLKGKEYNQLIYRIWENMLERCYSKSYHIKRPTYIGCVVCDKWLKFSNFHSWVEEQEWKGKQLDKDLLSKENKIYSEDTCVLISRELNLFMIERDARRGIYPIGVTFNNQKKKFQSKCSINGIDKHLGLYDTPEEAHQAWLSKKVELAFEYASLEKDPRISKAIMRKYQDYKVN